MSRHEQTQDIGRSLDMMYFGVLMHVSSIWNRPAHTNQSKATKKESQPWTQPCRTLPSGSATILANQDHRPGDQARLQFS